MKQENQKSKLFFSPIEDYGIIGNCHTAALVSSQASIDWLCLHRFDSPSIFAKILDLEKGGFWSIQPKGSFESKHQYFDETNVLMTTFTCSTGCFCVIDFMDITSPNQEQHPAAPGRLIRIVKGIEGKIEVISHCIPRPNYGKTIPNFTHCGTEIKFNKFILTASKTWQIDEDNHSLICSFTLHPEEQLAFTLMTEDDADLPHPEPATALTSTINFWQNWANQCTYQGPYRNEVIRSALTLRLMTYEPSGAIVAAPTTSLPETIGGERNWDYRFTWIRDASFTLYALLLAGYFDYEQPFFNWIVRTVKVEKTGIKILYPITSEGQIIEKTLDYLQGYRNSRPVRIGNKAVGQVQMDVYGEVMSALHFAWKTGKYDPSNIWDDIYCMLDWVAQHWCEPDSGIWEVRGGVRHFVYSKVMSWLALDTGIDIAKTLNLKGNINHWCKQRDLIREEVFNKGWSDNLKAFKQSYEDENLDAANLLLPVYGFIDGRDSRMQSTIDQTIKHLVKNGLCYRYLNAPEGVTGHESPFVLCTFWLINALILAGRLQEAQEWFEKMLAKSSSLGLFGEEIDSQTGAHLGNFPQAFSHIGVINVAVSLAHAGQTGTVEDHHANAANSAGRGGGGVKCQQNQNRKKV